MIDGPRLAPPTEVDLALWLEADRLARPSRLERFRARMAKEGVQAYFGVRRENTRYLTGLDLADGEEKVAGVSGQFFISADEVVVLADSRYTVQAREQCPEARIEDVYNDLPEMWPKVIASLVGPVKRIGMEAGFVSHATWGRLAAASPDVEFVPAEGWIEDLRQTKEAAELERVASSCAVADAALERLLPQIRPGVTEQELALALEWEMRTNGAEALAFGVACLAGERAALPHGSPTTRKVAAGEVLLFDFGAQVAGYRSDMTRTLFVGEPTALDLKIYTLVADAQEAAFASLDAAVAAGEHPINRDIDKASRDVIDAAGYGGQFGHGLGHGIGLATHELPSLGRLAAIAPLPSPTVFSVEPGIYLDGQTGVRIEDLVTFDPATRRLERITLFPREVTVVAG